jgi:S1-C subfamily serine protease
VQPGNSGGPALDASGNVVGVVVSRLNAIKFARVTRTLPQNVNFAVSEGTARAFLDGHDVPYDTARSNKTVPTADIAAKAKGYTVLIECWK